MMNGRFRNTLLAINKKDWQNMGNLTIKRFTAEVVELGAGLGKFDVRDALYDTP